MDFFQCLVVVGVELSSFCSRTTNDKGSLCSGKEGDKEEKLEKDAVLPGDTVLTSSESKMKMTLKYYSNFKLHLLRWLDTLYIW